MPTNIVQDALAARLSGFRFVPGRQCEALAASDRPQLFFDGSGQARRNAQCADCRKTTSRAADDPTWMSDAPDPELAAIRARAKAGGWTR